MKLVNDDAVILEEAREQRLWERGSQTPEPLANYMTRIRVANFSLTGKR